jgi:hypothetical protein
MIPRVAVLSSLLLAAGAALTPLASQLPTTPSAVPLYPGATRQADREETQLGPGSEGWVYRVTAPIEAVVKFYQERLRAREIGTEADRDRARDAYEQLGVGQTSGAVVLPVFVELTPAHFRETAGPGEDPARLAAAWRAAYVAKRPPFRPDTWLASAIFEWGAHPAADQRVEFYLSVEDVGAWQIRESAYEDVTEIVLNVQRTGPPPARAEEEEEPAPAAPMAAPSASELGVPVYPGAQFDGRLSASLSAGDSEGTYYVYTSTDSPATVTAFYEQRTGKKALHMEGGVLIAVRGEGPFPDLGITVQPNLGSHAPNVRTIVTVRRNK